MFQGCRALERIERVRACISGMASPSMSPGDRSGDAMCCVASPAAGFGCADPPSWSNRDHGGDVILSVEMRVGARGRRRGNTFCLARKAACGDIFVVASPAVAVRGRPLGAGSAAPPELSADMLLNNRAPVTDVA
jgi:hypothetical protein